MFSLLLVAYRLALFFYYAPIEKPATQATGFCLFGKKSTGGTSLQVANGMCRWMGSHFHDWIGYNGVALSTELLEWGHTFSDFWGVREFFIFTVSKRTRMFVL